MIRAVGVMGLVVVVPVVGVAMTALWQRESVSLSPWQRMPPPAAPVSHSGFFAQPFKTGPEVTRACLECHPHAAEQVMQTVHWTWRGHTVKMPGHEDPVSIGKLNLLNNFCIQALPNIAKCSACHAGYGWEDNSYTFDDPEKVDCLICHDQTNTYVKGHAGYPVEGVDLLAVARSVGRPTRQNCGQCHFDGAGGDGAKHGDLDGSLYHPSELVDVHMGKFNFQCVDCHRTREHEIAGMSMSVSVRSDNRVLCTDCHSQHPHQQQRLNSHADVIACQTCHIPKMAVRQPTELYWDWSQAGKDLPINDRHVYMKKKGSFEFASNVRPNYFWYNGTSTRYLLGDKIDPNQLVQINSPLGSIRDPESKIFPFKIHRSKQIYDQQHLHLLTPQTTGPGGYWSEYDWHKACQLGSEATGVAFSGEYGFVETEMYWAQSHMVQAKEKSLQCIDCHGQGGVLDWQDLGYDGDPAFHGSARRKLGIAHGGGSPSTNRSVARGGVANSTVPVNSQIPSRRHTSATSGRGSK